MDPKAAVASSANADNKELKDTTFTTLEAVPRWQYRDDSGFWKDFADARDSAKLDKRFHQFLQHPGKSIITI
eukprot:159962-Pyramimonas_sp.AAC.1